MADEVVQDEMPEVENDEFSFVVTDDNENVDPAKLETETKLAEQQAEIERLTALNAQTKVENTSQTQMDELANVIKTSMTASQPKEVAVDPQADYMKSLEDIRTNWHSDQVGNVIKIVEPLMTQMQNQMNTKVSTLELKTSKLAAVNGADKDIYTKYNAEVEQIASTLPPTENTYQEALKVVKANHMDDLVNDMVNEKLDALLAAKGLATSNSPATIASQADATLSGTNPTGNAALANAQKAKINSEEEKMLKTYALQHSINWDVPKYRNMLVNTYKANPTKFRR